MSSLGFLEQFRWYVSPKDIERMESYRPFFHVSGEATFFASATDVISTYTNQYVDGIISTQESAANAPAPGSDDCSWNLYEQTY